MVIISQSLNRFPESKDRVGHGIGAVIIAAAGMRSRKLYAFRPHGSIPCQKERETRSHGLTDAVI